MATSVDLAARMVRPLEVVIISVERGNAFGDGSSPTRSVASLMKLTTKTHSARVSARTTLSSIVNFVRSLERKEQTYA